MFLNGGRGQKRRRPWVTVPHLGSQKLCDTAGVSGHGVGHAFARADLVLLIAGKDARAQAGVSGGRVKVGREWTQGTFRLR